MRKMLFLCTLFFCSVPGFAQKSFSIKVSDAKTGNPISGASAIVKSTQKGATSNSEGIVQVDGKENDLVDISSVGYKPVSVRLSASTTVTVMLEPSLIDLGDIVVVGTRGAARAKTETPIPVDVIRINQVGIPSAKTDLTSILNVAAPSFNYNKQSGADGADHMDLGTLRGLGPDQTLVLINGKRRHQTAFVALFGTRGRANSGSDLNAFPQASVDRIEILRDGASAQYGSDAIAGVINVILKRDVDNLAVTAGWSGFYDSKFNAYQFRKSNQYYSSKPIDGGTVSFSLNNGFKLGKNGGFINFSLDYLNQEKTFRQVDTTNWMTDKWALPYINSGRRAFGDGSLQSGGGMFNMEVPTSASKKTSFYAFGGYNYKGSDAYAYSRNWSGRPNRFPVDASGNLIYDGAIMRTADDGEIYYNPHIQTHIQDASLATGIKSKFGNEWNWDLSNTVGRNDFHYFGDKTFNASQFLTAGTPHQTHFDDGGFDFLQNTTNLDFSKLFKTVAKGLNLGLGAEFRYERYSIYDGEEASWQNYHQQSQLYYPNLGDSAAPASGSQGFPGFQPKDEVVSTRTNESVYIDAELNATRAWLIDAALRFENYSDFGSVFTYKIATRIKAADNFNIRGSFSSGFRAPSLQQINFTNTLTSFSAGELSESLIASNTSVIARNAGLPPLKEETSLNGSIGFAWKPIRGLTFTVDGYMIKVKDRVVLSGLFDASTIPGVDTTVSTVQFFANAVNTTNMGIDIVADYSKKWGKQSFSALLAGNIQDMKIDDIHVPARWNTNELDRKTFYSDREVAFLKASAPKEKFSLKLEYHYNKFGVGVTGTYWGKIQLMGYGDYDSIVNPNQTGIDPHVPTDADPAVTVPEIFNFNSKVTLDAFVSYNIFKRTTLFIGADNILNTHPDLGVNPLAKGWFGDNESGGPWDSVQMGFNGLRIFAKLAFNLK